ncbi:hypothetical protein LCGC14_1041540 [marine sediment metagenome]|uniref:Uncharacterized protein n=1 Tax=marine sediment metagenome TaxID=412755 RepID=A0A0F9Q9T3_9ZZZZ
MPGGQFPDGPGRAGNADESDGTLAHGGHRSQGAAATADQPRRDPTDRPRASRLQTAYNSWDDPRDFHHNAMCSGVSVVVRGGASLYAFVLRGGPEAALGRNVAVLDRP